MELELIKKLAEYPEEVVQSAEHRAPHRIARYLYDLASMFHSFYRQGRIIGVDPALQQARLGLITAIALVLRQGLGILVFPLRKKCNRWEASWQLSIFFVTGGVVSSLGKGITAASLGRLLEKPWFQCNDSKFDPYINIDPGTMSPYQHGEVFVTDDGAETDLDLGHYERFIDINLSKRSNITAGKVYWSVINKERKGDYLVALYKLFHTLQMKLNKMYYRVGKEDNADVVITEIGGTVGDIESLPFMEAIRQVKKEVGRNDVLYIHVTLVPYINAAGELKTKPTQHSVKELRSIGIQPDILVCRSENTFLMK